MVFTPADKSELQTAVDGWCASTPTITASTPLDGGTYGEIGTWVVTGVNNMENLFMDKSSFNDDISGWDTSNVTNMTSMFNGASAFNGDIRTWIVSWTLHYNMSFMFNGATAFQAAWYGHYGYDGANGSSISQPTRSFFNG